MCRIAILSVLLLGLLVPLQAHGEGEALQEIFRYQKKSPGKGMWDNYSVSISTPGGRPLIDRVHGLEVRRGKLQDPSQIIEVSVDPKRGWVVTTSADPKKVQSLLRIRDGALSYDEKALKSLRPERFPGLSAAWSRLAAFFKPETSNSAPAVKKGPSLMRRIEAWSKGHRVYPATKMATKKAPTLADRVTGRFSAR